MSIYFLYVFQKEKVKIFVELPTSKSIECYIDLHETTLDLKQKIWESYKGLILKNQRLIYRKQIMKDHLMLKTYYIDNGSRVTLVSNLLLNPNLYGYFDNLFYRGGQKSLTV